MARCVSKTFEFIGCRFRSSSVFLRQNHRRNGERALSVSTALLFSEEKSGSSHQQMSQRCSFLKPTRRDRTTTFNSSHSFHTHSRLLTSSSSGEGKAVEKDVLGSCLTTENLIEAWFNEATPFGTVTIRNVPFDVHIQPLNPMEYPELNKSMVKLYYYDPAGSGETLVGHKLSELGKLCNSKVCAEEGRLDVSCDVPHGVRLPLVCVVTVPLKFDVDIESSGEGDVVIRGLESDRVSVHLKKGDCYLSSLKTGQTIVCCDSGSIISNKQLLGALSLQCGKDGTIKADRLQGLSVDCVTEQGDVDIKTVYADQWACRSHSGHLHVRDCHGHSTISSPHGRLTVDSLDGKLSAELGAGSADVYITRHESVHITSQKGDITLRFSEDGSSSLDLDAEVIEQEDSLPIELNDQGKGFLRTETEHTVRASAPEGRISLKKQDWLSAIKLQFGNPTP